MRRLRVPVVVILIAASLLSILASGCARSTATRVQAGATASTPTRTRTPVGGGTILVSPAQGGPGTRVAISGGGWTAGDTVGLRFEDPASQGQGTTYASATVAADGKVSMLITFPYDQQWASLPQVRLVMWSLEREQSASTLFRITAASATSAATPLPRPGSSTETPTRAAVASAFVPATATTGSSSSGGSASGDSVAVVQSSGLNVRSGPGTNYAVLVVVKMGARLQVTGRNVAGDWIRVVAADGTEGWVLRAMTNFTGAATIVSAAAPTATATRPKATATKTASVSPTPSATPVITEWRGEYWATKAMTGTPALVRNDAAVDFDWSTGTPATGLPVDGFAVRWSREVKFEAATYRFKLEVDDGARVLVDGAVLIDEWQDMSVRTVSRDAVLSAGPHSLVVEYYENAGRAMARFSWEKATAPTSFQGWKGEYFANRTLSGSPALVRDDSAVSFDWGTGAAAYGLPVDDFSVRWTRAQAFEMGQYRFSVKADDGVRVYIDIQPIIDRWYDGGGTETYTADLSLAGNRTIVVAYYDHSGAAKVSFWWEKLSAMTVPTVRAVAPGEHPTVLPTLPPPPAPALATVAAALPAFPTLMPPAPGSIVLAPTLPAPAVTKNSAAQATAVTAAQPAAGAWLQELLANPAVRDWNADGAVEARDQWISLANPTSAAADLSGCVLGDGVGGVYVVPASTVLEPGARLVLYGTQLGSLLKRQGGQVGFTSAGGLFLDYVKYPRTAPDAAYSRHADGTWRALARPLIEPGAIVSPASIRAGARADSPVDGAGNWPAWLRRLLSLDR